MYSEQFKEEMVKKMVVPGGLSATALAQKVGITQSTLSKWKRNLGTVNAVAKEKGKKRPVDWGAEEKLQALHETAKMGEEELGAYLRREGLHSVQLSQWTKEFLEGMKLLTPTGRRRRVPSVEKKRIKELERELRRKEKALAEASALLILKKKAALIWGEVEDEEQT